MTEIQQTPLPYARHLRLATIPMLWIAWLWLLTSRAEGKAAGEQSKGTPRSPWQTDTSRLAHSGTVLNRDSVLIDFLITAAELEYWVSTKPLLSEADRFYWDFGASHGPVAAGIPYRNPFTTIVHGEEVAQVEDVSFQIQPLGAEYQDEPIQTGITGPATIHEIAPINFAWTYTKNGESEELFGGDWAKLSLLENTARISFGQPRIAQVLPEGPAIWRNSLAVLGTSNTGNLPVFVKILFVPRRSTKTIEFTDTENSVALAARGRLVIDDLIVYDDVMAYEPGPDFFIDGEAASIRAKESLLSKRSRLFIPNTIRRSSARSTKGRGARRSCSTWTVRIQRTKRNSSRSRSITPIAASRLPMSLATRSGSRCRYSACQPKNSCCASTRSARKYMGPKPRSRSSSTVPADERGHDFAICELPGVPQSHHRRRPDYDYR